MNIGVELAIEIHWPLACTVLRRAGRAVDISVELAIDRGPYSVEAGR